MDAQQRSPKRARLDSPPHEHAPVSAKEALLAAAARDAAEHARVVATIAANLPKADPDDLYGLDSDADDDAAEAVEEPGYENGIQREQPYEPVSPGSATQLAVVAGRGVASLAAPPPALRALSSAAAPRAATRRLAPAAGRFDAPAWDAGARDFTVGSGDGANAHSSAGARTLPPLVAALAARGERPTLPLDPRSRVPRATRQAALDKLLERALSRCASSVSGATAVTAESAAARARAVADALAEEAALYARCASKAIYVNLLAQSMRVPAATPPTVAGAPAVDGASAPAPHTAAGATPAAAPAGRPPRPPPKPPLRAPVHSHDAEALRSLLARCAVVRSALAVPFFSECLAARAHSVSLGWTPPFYARRVGEPSRGPVAASDAAEQAADEAAAAEVDHLDSARAASSPPHALPEPQRQAPSPRRPRATSPPPSQNAGPGVPLPASELPLQPSRAPPIDEVDAWTDALLHGSPGRALPADRECTDTQAQADASEAPASALDARIAAIGAEALLAGAPRPRAPRPRSSPQHGSPRARAPAAVRDAVRACIRAYLDPLYHAGALSREEYKAVARRASEKVCARHAAAPDASFLAREEGRIHALLRDYIRRGRAQPASGAAAQDGPRAGGS